MKISIPDGDLDFCQSLGLRECWGAHERGRVTTRLLLRSVLILETAFEKVLRRVLRRCLALA